MENAVGPVLRMNDEVDLVVQAIEEDNPGVPIEVIDRGAYVRIQGSGFLKVTRVSLEKHLGRTFNMRELEQMLTAFAGRINTGSDEINWHLSGPAPAAGHMAAGSGDAVDGAAAAEAPPPSTDSSTDSSTELPAPEPGQQATGPNIPPSLHNQAGKSHAATNGGN